MREHRTTWWSDPKLASKEQGPNLNVEPSIPPVNMSYVQHLHGGQIQTLRAKSKAQRTLYSTCQHCMMWSDPKLVAVVVVVVVVDRFYIELFSALEQTHCARM